MINTSLRYDLHITGAHSQVVVTRRIHMTPSKVHINLDLFYSLLYWYFFVGAEGDLKKLSSRAKKRFLSYTCLLPKTDDTF